MVAVEKRFAWLDVPIHIRLELCEYESVEDDYYTRSTKEGHVGVSRFVVLRAAICICVGNCPTGSQQEIDSGLSASLEGKVAE